MVLMLVSVVVSISRNDVRHDLLVNCWGSTSISSILFEHAILICHKEGGLAGVIVADSKARRPILSNTEAGANMTVSLGEPGGRSRLSCLLSNGVPSQRSRKIMSGLLWMLDMFCRT
jgi:hypothetical protein